jgi:hypothetical protein
MPTKRYPLNRRRHGITGEALALFAELEAGPEENRKSFSDGAHQLARALGLISEFWGGCTPLDRSASPCWPDSCVSYWDWHACRAMRERLLKEAVAQGFLTSDKLPLIPHDPPRPPPRSRARREPGPFLQIDRPLADEPQ